MTNQPTAVAPDTAIVYKSPAARLLDSVARAQVAKARAVSDSLAIQYVKSADPDRENLFVQEMLRTKTYKGNSFLDIGLPSKDNSMAGRVRRVKDNWVVIAIICLLMYGGLVRIAFRADINRVIASAVDKQYFLEVTEEGNFIGFWAFLALLILFGLIFGLFLFELSRYYEVYYALAGPALFISLAITAISFFLIKVILLKVLGYIFGFGLQANRYISVLSLTYFCLSFAMLPVVVCLGLINTSLISIILLFAFVTACFLLIWLYIRNSILIISSFQFPKFYLFLYLCALEISPVLVLMKGLNI